MRYRVSLVVSVLAFSLFCLFPMGLATASDSFTLKVYQGVVLATGNVGDSKDLACDLTVSPRYRGYVAYATLAAEKLKEFPTKPDVSQITKVAIANYKNLVFAPAADYYYVAQAKDGRCYLLRLDSFENQGKPMGNWKLTFSVSEFTPK